MKPVIQKKWGIVLLTLSMMSAISLSACSNSNDDGANKSDSPANASANSGTKTDNTASTNANSNTSKTDNAADAEPAAPAEDLSPLGKYDPGITLTTIRHTNSGLKFLNGDTLDNNIYTKAYESELGVQVKNNWIVDDTQYAQKLNVSIVSGDLPDFFEVDPKQLQTLIDGDQLADLSDAYNKYASDLTKKIWGGNDITAPGLVTALSKGKLVALPINGGQTDDPDFIWVRQDWLDNLGLQGPKTMDDVINIAKAFATKDPDKNGKNDTFGLNMNKNIWDGYSGITGFMNGYGAYAYNPTNQSGTSTFWIKGADGKLAFADVQPEVKTALGKLQELFKAKAISPEWATMDGTKAAEFETSGKVGMHFGQFWNANWPLADMKKVNPKSEWSIFPLTTADGSPAKVQSLGYRPNRFIVVKKGVEHPEAVIKLLNLYMEKNYGKSRDENYHIVTQGKDQVNTFPYAAIGGSYADTNQNDYAAVQEALKSSDPSSLNPTAKGYYDNILAYRGGDLGQWWVEKVFGNQSTYEALAKYKSDPNNYVYNEFYGSPTETMTERGSTLKDLEATVFTKIIMGASLDEFDKFVSDWKSQGGDAITQEVNDWYANR